MRKIKKYLYPIVFSAVFLLLLVIIGLVLNAVLERGNYAGSAMIVLFIALWALIVAPIYCFKYSKIIYEEKTKLLVPENAEIKNTTFTVKQEGSRFLLTCYIETYLTLKI